MIVSWHLRNSRVTQGEVISLIIEAGDQTRLPEAIQAPE